MSASAARRVALDTVTRVRERSAYAHETFDAVLAGAKLDGRDTAFATRLAYGTIATRGTLDEAVQRHLNDPTRLEPTVGDALAVAAYELLFMRTPARAAVSQGVELVRSVRSGAAGLANAVLRKVANEAESFPWGDPQTDIAALARLHGHPDWLARLLTEQYGLEAAAAFMAADNEPAPLHLAWLPSVGTFEELLSELEEVGARPQPCPLAGCIIAEEPSAARSSRAVRERRALVIDAAAQFAVAAMRPSPGMRAAEFGAGRGSKSLLLAAQAASQGDPASVAAIDLHAHKLSMLRSDADRLGVPGITTITADAISGDLDVAEDSMDAVLVDAPCSGLGTLRRHPDRRWRAQPAEIQALAALGTQMLERAARLVRPGGFVVYSTCTIAREENADVIRAFLESEQGSSFSVDPLTDDVPEGWERFVAPEGWFQSLPVAGGPDGHFVARLVRG